jgi:hypothetical protein
MYRDKLLARSSARAEDRARTGHPQLGRLMLYQMSYFRLKIFNTIKNFKSWANFKSCEESEPCPIYDFLGGERRIRTFEAVKQQIYSLSHLAALESPLPV